MARDTNFYYSFLVLPAAKRRAILAVWDFCRAVDDAVDEVPEADGRDALQRAQIARWRAEVAAVFGAGAPLTPQGKALLHVVGSFRLSRDPFDALVEGVEMDLGDRRYETFGELYEYCIRVASAVGHMCVEVFGCRDAAARAYATELGVALQLTNILRDVPGDLARGRVYIPQEDLRAHGCSEGDLRRERVHAGVGIRSAAVKGLLALQARRAHEYYDRAALALPRRHARALAAAEIMGATYRSVLRRIERSEYDVFTRVARISRPHRAAIAALTWARTVLRP